MKKADVKKHKSSGIVLVLEYLDYTILALQGDPNVLSIAMRYREAAMSLRAGDESETKELLSECYQNYLAMIQNPKWQGDHEAIEREIAQLHNLLGFLGIQLPEPSSGTNLLADD